MQIDPNGIKWNKKSSRKPACKQLGKSESPSPSAPAPRPEVLLRLWLPPVFLRQISTDSYSFTVKNCHAK